VDFVEIMSASSAIPPEVVRVWMCAQHWDEHQQREKTK
jgi:hypothetical protein